MAPVLSTRAFPAVRSARESSARMDLYRRLGVVTEIAQQLAGLSGEHELREILRAGLSALFEHARAVELLHTHASGEFVPATGSESARALIRTLRARREVIGGGRPGAVRAQGGYSTPRRLPREPRAERGPLLLAPILDRGAMRGLLAVEAEPHADDFTHGDLETLTSVAAQVSLVMQRLRAEEARHDRAELARDLARAREIQRRFLPALAAEVGAPEGSEGASAARGSAGRGRQCLIGGFRVHAEYRPALEVGGDFYDVVTTAPGQVTVAIGDVSGKGVAAALVMSRVATDFRRLAEAGRTPAELLAELSRSMFDEAPDDTFATAACLRLDTRRQRMTIANAGHVLPLRRRASGQVEPLRALGSPLGIHGAQPYVEEEFDLHPGDLILLMTDGVAEALECDSDPFAMERLCALVAQAPRDPAGLSARILEEVARASGERRLDDVTLLALELA